MPERSRAPRISRSCLSTAPPRRYAGRSGSPRHRAGEAGAAYADAGPLAWIDYGGDVQQIEFCEYVDVTGTRVHRRVVKREIVGTVFPVVKLNLSREATALPTLQRSFSPLDFDPAQFD